MSLDKDGVSFEIACRQMVVERLARVLTKLNRDANAEREAVMTRQSQLRAQYPTEEDAHEAFGWGYITEAEYHEIAGQLDEADKPTETSAARDILRDILARLRQEIRDFKWEALSEDEKERIRNSRTEFAADLKRQRKEATQ